MAKPMLLSLSVCLLLLFHGCLARSRTAQYQDQNQCELNRLEAREPDHRVECEGGLLESWDPNHEQFECVGVALARFTIQPNSLHLPSYTNAPQLIHIIRGRGVLGTLFPGCPETFEEPQQAGSGGGQSSSQRDRHQHIRHIKEGDIVALPAGFAYWSYNDGDQPLVTVNFLDVSNNDNQLDLNPRRFYLAGNPHDEFSSRRVPQGQRGRLSEERQRRREEEKQQEGLPNNIFSGFSVRLIQESFNVDAETARRIQNQNDFRGSIIRVKDRLDLVRPPRSRQEQEHEMRRQELQQIEREHSRRQAERDNGVEETFCTMRLRENLGDPARADLFSPQAGRLTTVNSYNLPVLNWLQLSAERGFLYSNAMYSPHYNINAHSIIYAIRGRARVQVVDNFGRSVFDVELRQGQALTVPQNFALVKQAENEGFEWVSFKTNDRAKVHQLAGRISFIRAMPEDVIANAYQISREQARRLQNNRQEASLFTTSRQSGIRPVVTA